MISAMLPATAPAKARLVTAAIRERLGAPEAGDMMTPVSVLAEASLETAVVAMVLAAALETICDAAAESSDAAPWLASSAGDPRVGESSVGESSVGLCSVGDWSVGLCSVGDCSVGDWSVGDWSVGLCSVGDCRVGLCRVGDWSVGLCSVGDCRARAVPAGRASAKASDATTEKALIDFISSLLTNVICVSVRVLFICDIAKKG